MKTIVSLIDWEELISKLKLKYPKLTEADLNFNKGKEQEMLRMVEYKLHKTKQEMEIIIDKLLGSNSANLFMIL
jgi:hypothetical protein